MPRDTSRTRGNPQRPNTRPLRQTTNVLAPVRAPRVVPLATWNELHPQVLRQQREPALHTVRLSRNCQQSKPVAHSPILRASLKSLRPPPTEPESTFETLQLLNSHPRSLLDDGLRGGQDAVSCQAAFHATNHPAGTSSWALMMGISEPSQPAFQLYGYRPNPTSRALTRTSSISCK